MIRLPPTAPARLQDRPATHKKTRQETERQLADGKGEGDGGGAKSHDSKKASFSVTNSILSGQENERGIMR
jgi:hypothetical protein